MVLCVGLFSPLGAARHPDVNGSVGLPAPERVKFNNLSFDLGGNWVVMEQAETMLLRPTDKGIADRAQLRVGPAMTARGQTPAQREADSQAQLDQLWPSLISGREIAGSVAKGTGNLNIDGDARTYHRSAYFKSGGGVDVYLICDNRSDGKRNGPDFRVTLFVLATDSVPYAQRHLVETYMLTTLNSARFESGEVISTSARSGGFDVGFKPSDQGPDPYDSIDWDGPDQFANGVYDIHPVNPIRELKQLTMLGQPFIGTVQPKEMNFNEALAHVRSLLNDPKTKSEYEALKKKMGGTDPFMLQGVAFAGIVSGRPFDALMDLFAAYELYPNDPDTLLNLAGMLAHVGMPNESMAVLKEMERRGKKPSPPAGINPDAAIEYLKGYNQLLIGQTLTAKGHLHQAINLDPFLKEAAVALAVAQKMTGEEEEAEKTYYYGVWRRRPAQYVLCGGVKSKPENQTVRPPITDMMDVSHGTPGVLPQFHHPENLAQALGLKDRYERVQLQTRAEVDAGLKEGDALMNKLSARRKTASEVWANHIDFLIETLGDEPVVKKLWDAREKAKKELAEATTRIAQHNAPIEQQLVETNPHNYQAEFNKLAEDGLRAVRPFAQAYDLAVRRLHRTMHRYFTGLAAHLGDRDWHKRETLWIRDDTGLTWGSLVSHLESMYHIVTSAAVGKDPSGDAEKLEHPEVAECPDGMRDLALQITIKSPLPAGEGPEFSLKQTCEGVGFEAAFMVGLNEEGLIETAAGVFAALEIARHGDMTIFAGGKGQLGVAGASSEGRAGVYFTAGHDGQIKDMGARANLEGLQKVAGMPGVSVTLNRELHDGKMSFMPCLPMPERGPDLRAQ